MNMYDQLFSPNCVLNEQIATQIFSILPERGPITVIMDRRGGCWASDSERFSDLNLSDSFLKELCGKIDDGDEPVITQMGHCSVVAAQLATEQANCGYIIIILPRFSPESTLTNIDLVEMLLGLAGLVARLVEANNHLYQLQLKQFKLYGQCQMASN